MATKRRPVSGKYDTQPYLFDIRTAEQIIRDASKPSQTAAAKELPIPVLAVKTRHISRNFSVIEVQTSQLIDDITGQFKLAAKDNFLPFLKTNRISHSSLSSLEWKELDKIGSEIKRLPENNESSRNYKFHLIYSHWRLHHLKECFDQVTTEGIGTFLRNYDYKCGLSAESNDGITTVNKSGIKFTYKPEPKSLSTFQSLASNQSFMSAYRIAHDAYQSGNASNIWSADNEHRKVGEFLRLMKDNLYDRAMVLVKYIHTANALADKLNKIGITASVMETNANVKSSLTARLERKQKTEDFRKGEVPVMIATSLGSLAKGDYTADLVIVYGHTSYIRSGMGILIRNGILKPGWGRAFALVANGTREEVSERKLIAIANNRFNGLLRQPSKQTKRKSLRMQYEGLSNTDLNMPRQSKRFPSD